MNHHAVNYQSRRTTAPSAARSVIDPVELTERALAQTQDAIDTARVAVTNQTPHIARELLHETDEHVREARCWLTFL